MATPVQLYQEKYWGKLKHFLETSGSFITISNPLPQSWLNIPLGKEGICLAVAVNSKTTELYVWLLLHGKHGKEYFDRLKKIAYEKSLIEINKDLVWDRMDENIRSAVKLSKSADYTKEEDWERLFIWFKTNLEKFSKFFKKQLINI